jgi:hypothetical protein
VAAGVVGAGFTGGMDFNAGGVNMWKITADSPYMLFDAVQKASSRR